MENGTSTAMLVWSVKILSFTILILTLYATVTIFKSIWFRFWASRNMSDMEKREFHIENKYDIKWTSCMVVMLLLGFIKFQLVGLKDLSWWNLLCAFLFGFLLWGNYRTLNILKNFLNTEKDRLKRKKDFGI